MKVGSLFTGIGGFDLGFERAGMEIAWQVEIDEFCNKVLAKHWPNVKRFKDVKTVSGKELEPVDLLCGGVPCQPASCAGKRRGTKDDRWLWKEPFRIIAELDPKPKWCVFENVRGLLTLENGLVFDNLLSELENLGYETRTFCIPACAVNAPHRRDRVWIVANSERKGSHGSEAQTYGRGEYIWQRDEMGNGLESSIDCHAPDTEKSKCELSGRTRARREGFTDGCFSTAFPNGARSEIRLSGQDNRKERNSGIINNSSQERNWWKEPWLEVASEFCGIYNGLSDWIHRHYDRIISEEDYEITTQKDRTQGVSILRKAIQSEEIWEQVGRILQIPEKGILLTFLLYFQGESIKKGEQVESAEVGNNKGLRNLWNNSGFKRSSQRFKLHEQRARELTNIMPELPFQTARVFAKITDYITCGESTMSNRDRVNRLKALGNAVVPQIPEILGRAIMGIEHET